MNRGVARIVRWYESAAGQSLYFLLKMALVYGVWKLIQWTGGLSLRWYDAGDGVVGRWHDLLAPAYNSLIHNVGKALLYISHFIVTDVLGFPAQMILEWRDYKGIPQEFRIIQLPGTKGIHIAESCLGIAPMIVLAGAVMAYPGPWYHRLWFIPLGMLGAQAGNVFRIVGLALIQKHVPREILFTLSHSYVYLIICYSIVFLFIRWWIKRFGT